MKKKQEPLRIKTFTGDVAEMSRDMWLAGLGAVATVEEEGTKFYENLRETSTDRLKKLQEEATALFDDLVKRGEKFERDRIDPMISDMGRPTKELAEQVEETVAGSVEKTLAKLDVPTRTEVHTLTEQVERLTAQVQELTVGLEG